jgi:hypothetical protein
MLVFRRAGSPPMRVYGADPGLRADLERCRVGYVLAVAVTHRVTTAAGSCQARQIATRLPRRAWQRYSAGEGAKGHHRYYDWAWVATGPAKPGHRWLLIRRNRRTRELAFYRCYSARHEPVTGAEHRHTVGRILARRHDSRIPGLIDQISDPLQQGIESGTG